MTTCRDVDAAMADMTAATSLRHIPAMTGADGRPELEHFYRDVVLPHLPGDHPTLTDRGSLPPR